MLFKFALNQTWPQLFRNLFSVSINLAIVYGQSSYRINMLDDNSGNKYESLQKMQSMKKTSVNCYLNENIKSHI